MFSAFNLSLKSEEIVKDYYKHGYACKIINTATIKTEIDRFLTCDGEISASDIENEWFRLYDANIFISHSHADEEMVIRFSGFLDKEFGLKCFIDSCAWKYVNDLLKMIDDKYCKKRDGSYDYNSRNVSTSHAYMILNGALAKMINKTECLIFVNSPNSIKMNSIKSETYSPWIYSELLLATEFPHRDLSYYRKKTSLQHIFETASNIPIKYEVPIDDLIPLSVKDISRAGQGCKGTKVLDQLYHNKGII